MKKEALVELEAGTVTAPIALTKLLRLHELCGGYLPLHEEDEWDELWEIFRGQKSEDYIKWYEENKDKYTEEQIDNAESWMTFFNGSGLSSWWD